MYYIAINKELHLYYVGDTTKDEREDLLERLKDSDEEWEITTSYDIVLKETIFKKTAGLYSTVIDDRDWAFKLSYPMIWLTTAYDLWNVFGPIYKPVQLNERLTIERLNKIHLVGQEWALINLLNKSNNNPEITYTIFNMIMTEK